MTTKFRYPLEHKEFWVASKTHLGAAIKANNKLKKEFDKEDGWRIKSLYWLDPICYEDKRR